MCARVIHASAWILCITLFSTTGALDFPYLKSAPHRFIHGLIISHHPQLFSFSLQPTFFGTVPHARFSTADMIEDLLVGMTPGRATLWALGLFIAFCVFRKLQASAQIARLGARAPKIPFRLPYGTLSHTQVDGANR